MSSTSATFRAASLSHSDLISSLEAGGGVSGQSVAAICSTIHSLCLLLAQLQAQMGAENEKLASLQRKLSSISGSGHDDPSVESARQSLQQQISSQQARISQLVGQLGQVERQLRTAEQALCKVEAQNQQERRRAETARRQAQQQRQRLRQEQEQNRSRLLGAMPTDDTFRVTNGTANPTVVPVSNAGLPSSDPVRQQLLDVSMDGPLAAISQMVAEPEAESASALAEIREELKSVETLLDRAETCWSDLPPDAGSIPASTREPEQLSRAWQQRLSALLGPGDPDALANHFEQNVETLDTLARVVCCQSAEATTESRSGNTIQDGLFGAALHQLTQEYPDGHFELIGLKQNTLSPQDLAGLSPADRQIAIAVRDGDETRVFALSMTHLMDARPIVTPSGDPAATWAQAWYDVARRRGVPDQSDALSTIEYLRDIGASSAVLDIALALPPSEQATFLTGYGEALGLDSTMGGLLVDITDRVTPRHWLVGVDAGHLARGESRPPQINATVNLRSVDGLNKLPNFLAEHRPTVLRPYFQLFLETRSDAPRQYDSIEALYNDVGIAMGLPIERAPTDEQGAFCWYGEETRSFLAPTVEAIVEANQGRIPLATTILPVVIDGPEFLATEPLFRVDTPSGEAFVDTQGVVYDGHFDADAVISTGQATLSPFADWLDNNSIPNIPGATITAPEGGHLARDAEGRVLLSSTAAYRTGEQVVDALDTIAAGAGLVVGTMGIVGTGGALAPMVGGVLMAYGGVRSADNIRSLASHHQDLSWSNPAARAEYLNLASTGLGLAALGGTAALRFAPSAPLVKGTACALSGAQLADLATGADLGLSLVNNWDGLSTQQKAQMLGNLVFWFGQVGRQMWNGLRTTGSVWNAFTPSGNEKVLLTNLEPTRLPVIDEKGPVDPLYTGVLSSGSDAWQQSVAAIVDSPTDVPETSLAAYQQIEQFLQQRTGQDVPIRILDADAAAARGLQPAGGMVDPGAGEILLGPKANLRVLSHEARHVAVLADPEITAQLVREMQSPGVDNIPVPDRGSFWGQDLEQIPDTVLRGMERWAYQKDLLIALESKRLVEEQLSVRPDPTIDPRLLQQRLAQLDQEIESIRWALTDGDMPGGYVGRQPSTALDTDPGSIVVHSSDDVLPTLLDHLAHSDSSTQLALDLVDATPGYPAPHQHIHGVQFAGADPYLVFTDYADARLYPLADLVAGLPSDRTFSCMMDYDGATIPAQARLSPPAGSSRRPTVDVWLNKGSDAPPIPMSPEQFARGIAASLTEGIRPERIRASAPASPPPDWFEINLDSHLLQMDGKTVVNLGYDDDIGRVLVGMQSSSGTSSARPEKTISAQWLEPAEVLAKNPNLLLGKIVRVANDWVKVTEVQPNHNAVVQPIPTRQVAGRTTMIVSETGGGINTPLPDTNVVSLNDIVSQNIHLREAIDFPSRAIATIPQSDPGRPFSDRLKQIGPMQPEPWTDADHAALSDDDLAQILAHRQLVAPGLDPLQLSTDRQYLFSVTREGVEVIPRYWTHRDGDWLPATRQQLGPDAVALKHSQIVSDGARLCGTATWDTVHNSWAWVASLRGRFNQAFAGNRARLYDATEAAMSLARANGVDVFFGETMPIPSKKASPLFVNNTRAR